MTEAVTETFLTTVPDEKQLKSIIINDYEDDIDIDVKSSTDSDDSHTTNNEIEEILNSKQVQDISSVLLPTVATDNLQDKMSHNDPSPSAVGEHLQTFIPRAVYEYAAVVNDKLESPRQNKLDHDVNAVLGSSDPPPGFGFLHPRFYYLEQKRPVPMEPLRVWRGYNGHVYFSPIQVQQLEADRIISPSVKPRKSTTRAVASLSAKVLERSRTVLSAYRNKKSAPYKNTTNKEKNSSENSLTRRKTYPRTTSDETQLRNNTLATFIEGEENNQENDVDNNRKSKESEIKMWRSVVTCVPVQVKPISKRSQYTMEDLQEQMLQDSTGYTRQVLPNIRPIPKSKFVYKGLAYKEVKKIPGIMHHTQDDLNNDIFKKPLIDYNLAQAYVRYEVNAERAKQTPRNLPPSTIMTATTTTAMTTKLPARDSELSKTQTSLDLREIRKRIVKGSTLNTRPAPQSASWTPGRSDNKSILGSEVLLPVRNLSTLYRAPTLPLSPPFISLPSPLPIQHTMHTTPTLSQLFEQPPIDT